MSRQILTADLDESNNDNRLPAVLNAHANLSCSRSYCRSGAQRSLPEVPDHGGGVVGKSSE